MKNSPIFFAALLLIVHNILALANLFAASSDQIMSAAAYDAFLNQAAASDSTHLYNEKMSIVSGGASILRSGVPGNYHYELVTNERSAGKNAMAFLSHEDVGRYSNFSKTDFTSSVAPDVIDKELHANNVTFVTAAAEQCSGAGAIVGLSYAEDFIGLAIFFEWGVGRREVEVNDHLQARGATDESDSRNEGIKNNNGAFIDQPQTPFGGHSQAVVVFDRKLQDLPDFLIDQIVSFLRAPETVNAYGMHRKKYEQKYQKSFELLQFFDGDLIKKKFSLKIDNAFVLHKAGIVMEIFHSFQKKWFKGLENQKQKDISILLASASKKDEKINQMVTRIKSLLQKIQTCKEKSEQPIVQQTSAHVQSYKNIEVEISHRLDAYLDFAQKTGMKDPLETHYFLRAQDAFEKKLEYLLLREERLASFRENGFVADEDTFKAYYLYLASFIIGNEGDIFQLAIKRKIPLQAMLAYEEALTYSFLRAAEIVENGESGKSESFRFANNSAQSAGDAFEKGNLLQGYYDLKRAKIYGRKGIESGNAFTMEAFKKYQLRKLKRSLY